MPKRKKILLGEYIGFFKTDENEWSFEYPRINYEIIEQLHYAIELMDRGDHTEAKSILHQLTREFPEFIDAHHHLAIIEEGYGEGLSAFLRWQNIVDLCLSKFPSTFYFGRDRLPWTILENRPFLRAYQSLGVEYLERGEVEKASMIFNNILDMNPNDNQGIRALQVDCYFRLKRPGNILGLMKNFPDDTAAETIYGNILALYQLGYLTQAKKALKNAIRFLPTVAEEIVKKRHRRPKSLFQGYVTHGGADEAYYYWEEQGEHWKQTPGAIDFVRLFLKRI